MKYLLLRMTLIYTLFSNSINMCTFQEKYTDITEENNLLESLHLELKNPHYRKEILPNDFSYLVNLIECGISTNQPPAYVRSVIKLFSNVLKGSDYVNAHAFFDLITKFPTILPHYFSLNVSTRYLKNHTLFDVHMYDRLQETVNDMLYFKFSTEYDSFKKNPTAFLSDVSNLVTDIVQEEVTCEQVRQSIVHFCDIALSKLLWNPQDQEKTWNTTKQIADQLASLLDHNILDDTNDLDDLYWTLLYRYSYFIDLTATDMQPSFYESIRHDITNESITLLELEEQDSIIESKKRHLTRTLMEAEAKSYGYKHGLITG